MSLSTGQRLGPYEITAAVGAGGMGEVYRANDTKLDREVAVKVLAGELARDAERLTRFEREAKLLASLNHPNIAHVYGFESATLDDGSSVHFLAMELVEGEDLAERLKRGAIPADESLEIAKQIAEALEEAHEHGIVHRDLKPANVKVTPAGKVRVLDFGLAKACAGEAAGAPPDLSQSPTLARSDTQAGVLLGTAAYMSPEQARGKPVDKRADIWAFGVVLYEMLTGRRLFSGETVSDTLAAVLTLEPDWSDLPKSIGAATVRVLARCLEKDLERRYRDIGDVALDLAAGPVVEAEQPTPHGRGRLASRRAWSVAAVSAAVAVGLGAVLWQQLAAGRSVPRYESLTFGPQYVTNARFAPDGRTVVFSTARQGNTSELFVRHPEDLLPRLLGKPDTQLLSVASTGELAVLTRTRYRNHRTYIGTLARMPLGEASPREVLGDVTAADWSPDGARFAIVRQVEGRSRLEYPIGNVLAESAGYLSDVRVSPKGDRIAFMSHPFAGDDRGRVVIVDGAGQVAAQSPVQWGAQGLAWVTDAEVLFSGSDDGGEYRVQALSLVGAVRNVLTAPTSLVITDRANDGRLLVATETNRKVVVALLPGAAAERDVPWLDQSIRPVLSRDGRSFVFGDESAPAGHLYATYFQGTDGSPPVRLGDGSPQDISPDGASVLVLVTADPPRLTIYPVGAGAARDLPGDGFVTYDYESPAHFFDDGHSVAFCASRAGGVSQCFAHDLAGGSTRAVTPEGTDHGRVSPDGTEVVARSADGSYRLYAVAGSSEPVPVPGLDGRDQIISWRSDGRSLLVFRPAEMPTRVDVLEIATGRRTLLRELAPSDRAGALRFYQASFSADERSYAYSFTRKVGSLFTVEGPR